MSLPDANNIALIRQMMDTLGVSAADLVSAATAAPAGVPTVDAFHATVLALATDGQRRTYANHWRSLVEAYGYRPVNSLRKTELEALAQAAKKNARTRANSRKGSGAQENCVAALRHFFTKAVDDGLLRENPALKLAKPKRRCCSRTWAAVSQQASRLGARWPSSAAGCSTSPTKAASTPSATVW